MEGHTVHMLFFRHMILDHLKSLLTEVHKGEFMNEIDSFGTSEVTQVSMEIKHGIKVKTYRCTCKWGIIQRLSDKKSMVSVI